MDELKRTVELLREEYDVWFYERQSDREYVYDYVVVTDDLDEHHPGGVSTDREAAMQSALGEYLEFVATTYDPDETVEHPYADVRDRALDPRAVVDFADDQYDDECRYERIHDDTPIHWVAGTDLHTDDEVLLPGYSVFLDYNDHHARHYPNYSFGSGSHADLDAALRRGILELLEIDAAMLFWHHRVECPQIDLSTLDGEVRDLIGGLRGEGLVPTSVALELDLPVPTVLSYVEDPAGTPRYSFGLGSGETVESAVESSLEECVQIRNTLQLIEAEDGEIPAVATDEFDSYVDRAYYYADGGESDELSFLRQLPKRGRDELDHVECDTSLSALTELLAAEGLDAYYADLTAGAVRDAGRRQVKVVIPDLLVANIQPEYRFLGNPRLESVPAALGVEPDANPHPHPIP